MATFDQLMEAVCGLVALLSAQFYTYSFTPGPDFLSLEGGDTNFDSCIGSYFGFSHRPGLPKIDTDLATRIGER